MSNDPVRDQELERAATRIRQSIRHLLTAPRNPGGDWRHASFGAIGSGGVPRPDMTEHAVELSAQHVIREREPRVIDLMVKPKLRRGKLVSLAVSYTIRASNRRDTLAIAY